MTIKELIEELKKFPDETPVYMDNGDYEVQIDDVTGNNRYGFIHKVVIS